MPANAPRKRPSPGIDDQALYFVDGGLCLCGSHLGMTARTTGRDISGQKIKRVTDRDRAEWKLIPDLAGVEIACERCHPLGSTGARS